VVGFAVAEEGEGELGVGWDAFEDCAGGMVSTYARDGWGDLRVDVLARLEKLLPVRDCAVEPTKTAGENWITEEDEADEGREGFQEDVRGHEERDAEQQRK
jgi:hypothetical protein